MKIIVNNKQGYKIYHNFFGCWELRGAPRVVPFYVENIGQEDSEFSILKTDAMAPTLAIYMSSDMTVWEKLGDTSTEALKLTLVPGERVYIRCNTESWCVEISGTSRSNVMQFVGSEIKVGGNSMSLIYGENFTGREENFPEGSVHTLYGLFTSWGYTSALVDAGDMLLPSTTLTTRCYEGMFYSCSNLRAAPVLPAKTLADYCYRQMFFGCAGLNHIKCLATDLSASDCLYNWVLGVAYAGTFVKDANTTWPSGFAGIPNNWTVEDDTIPVVST